MYLKTQGLVLRVTEYRDSDAILSVLTREQGLMTFKARGVRSRRSQIKSACQLLAFSEFTVLERQGYYTVSEAVCIEMFQPMRNDIELLSLCSYFAQAAELLSQQDVNDGEVLSLTLNAIYALCKLKRPQPLVKAAFELRMMVIAAAACAEAKRRTGSTLQAAWQSAQSAARRGASGFQSALRVWLRCSIS